MPVDLARIGKDITFINARTIKPDVEKSQLFTNALKEAGFVFPVKLDGSNPDVFKPFDAGFFLIDSKNDLYRLYMVKGQPVVNKYKDNLKNENILIISIRENKNTDFYGFMVTDKGRIIMINKDHTLSTVDVENYDPYKDSIKININPLHTLITVANENKQTALLYDTNYKYIKQYSTVINDNMKAGAKTVYNIIFPYVLYNDNYSAEQYLKIDISQNPAGALCFMVFLAAVYMLVCYKSKNITKAGVIDIVIILTSGIYGFTALILLQNFKRDTLWE